MEQVKIGIIGGSGLYQMPELTDITEVEVDTPFGKPSDAFIIGTLEGERVAFLPRHGRGHKLTPSELPFRANIYAMKLARRRLYSVGFGGRKFARRLRADGFLYSRSVF